MRLDLQALARGRGMTSRERLLAAYRCQPVDRVPIRVWGADPWMELWHPSYRPIYDAAGAYSDIVLNWSGPIVATNGFFSDPAHLPRSVSERPSEHEGFLDRITTYDTPHGPLTQVEVVSSEHKPGRILKFMVETEADAQAWLSVPYVPCRPDVRPFFDLQQRLGERGLVHATFDDPISLVYFLMGSERLALWSLEKRDLLREMISVAQQRLLDYVSYLLEQGVGPCFAYFGSEICLPPLMHDHDFQEFALDINRPFVQMIRQAGGLVWLHCHGRMRRAIRGLADIGVNCVNPMEPPPLGDLTLREARHLVGARLCLEGNIEADDLFRGTPEHVRELVRQAIEQARGGGFVLCPTSAFMEWPTCNPEKVQNYLAFIEAGLEFGQDFA